MFRKIRKTKNEMSEEDTMLLLETERRGVLCVLGDDGYPYGVPLNYLYDRKEGKIWFHGSRTGHKIDSLMRCDKVCFTVCGHETRKDGEWAPYAESAVVFGRCRPVEGPDETIRLLRRFAEKYYPDRDLMEKEIASSGNAVRMLELTVEHLSGKRVQES